MIRAAAKNHAYVAVVTDPADYADVLDELEAHNGATTLTSSASGSPPRPLRAPPPMTRRSRAGSPSALGDETPDLARLRRQARIQRCAMARTRISRPAST
jgi:hypothetical protein